MTAPTPGLLRKTDNQKADYKGLNPYYLLLITYLVPVDPNPPAPRSVSSSSETSVKAALMQGTITSWAMRSPG